MPINNFESEAGQRFAATTPYDLAQNAVKL